MSNSSIITIMEQASGESIHSHRSNHSVLAEREYHVWKEKDFWAMFIM